MMELSITVTLPPGISDPRTRVLAIEKCVETICQEVNEDAADGVMVLLTAAAHIHMRHAKPGVDIAEVMADVLGNAIIAAKAWFPIRRAAKTGREG